MASGVPDRSVWDRRGRPILVGAVGGLVTGFLGLFVTTALSGSPWGGIVGAAGCGITAVYLTPDGFFDGLLNAVVADVLSSVAFFLLFLIGYLAFVRATEGLSVLSATLFAGWFVGTVGLGVAVPIGIISLGITVVAGAVTAVLQQRLTSPRAAG